MVTISQPSRNNYAMGSLYHLLLQVLPVRRAGCQLPARGPELTPIYSATSPSIQFPLYIRIYVALIALVVEETIVRRPYAM